MKSWTWFRFVAAGCWMMAWVLNAGSASYSAPPATAKKTVTDEYHGEQVQDDYRWLEDASNKEVQAWSDAQNVHAREVLDALPSVDAIRARLTELEKGASVSYDALHWRATALFALKHEPTRQQPLIVSLTSANDLLGERTVVDPNVIDPAGGTSIDWYVPSLDGKLVAVSLSEGGSESGTVHVYAVPSGEELKKDLIPRVNGGTAGGSLAWDADGFYYTRYPRGTERPPEDLDFYQQVYYHRLGTATDEDTYQIGETLPRIAEIQLESSLDGKWVLASVQKGDGGEFEHHLRAPQGAWKQLTRFEDKVVSAALGVNQDLYLLSRQGAPRGKILRSTLESFDLATSQELVPESEATIEPAFFPPAKMIPTASRLYVVDQLGGPNQIRIFPLDGRAPRNLPLPPVSTVEQIVRTDGDDVLVQTVSYVSPPAWYQYSSTSEELTKTGLFQTSPADYSDCEVVREFATSKDGTQVPISIIRRKGTKLDGKNPTVVWGYGGYGVSETPAFSPRRRVFIEQGGVFAIANIRGGGEFGEAWHLAGNLTHKQNVFDDFYAAARHMLEAGYTSREKLAIMGGSNGGLLMGATFTQHPDLCQAVVSMVGIYDMLRVELSANGAFNVTEFGTVKDLDQFRALLAYSPYHHVKAGTRYPSILFLTGANDPRVDPMQSRKMTALLQASSPRSRTLLRTSANSGHGIGSSLSERIEQSVDIYSFLFNELKVNYQPIASSANKPARP